MNNNMNNITYFRKELQFSTLYTLPHNTNIGTLSYFKESAI